MKSLVEPAGIQTADEEGSAHETWRRQHSQHSYAKESNLVVPIIEFVKSGRGTREHKS